MYKDLLLPIDLNEESSWSKSLPVAIEFTRKFGARLHVMTVVPDFGMSIVGQFFPADFASKALAAADTRLHEFVTANVPNETAVQHVVTDGTVYERILTMAERLEIDLIVMAAHRPELSDYLLGPNAARVVRHAKCSVLVVR
jgi:nucleotide-binding universal stress UspA family protein